MIFIVIVAVSCHSLMSVEPEDQGEQPKYAPDIR